MRNFILIANPISGKGNARNIAEQAYAALTESGHQGQLVFTSASGDAMRFAREAVSDGIQSVIACGGDGTLHEVVNGIAMVPDVTLGVLPCGRGNDFAAAVGIPLKPDAAIATLLSGTPIRVDLGCCYQNSSQQEGMEEWKNGRMDASQPSNLPTFQPNADNQQPTTNNYFESNSEEAISKAVRSWTNASVPQQWVARINSGKLDPAPKPETTTTDH